MPVTVRAVATDLELTDRPAHDLTRRRGWPVANRFKAACIGGEDLHICPAHLGMLDPLDVLSGDNVLVLQADGALEHATVEHALHSVVVLAPHAGG
jgi:hypothetical protein